MINKNGKNVHFFCFSEVPALGEEFPRFEPLPEPELDPETGFDLFLIMSSVMTMKVERRVPNNLALTFLAINETSSSVKLVGRDETA